MTQKSDRATVWLLMIGVAVVGSNSLALSPILTDVAAGLSATSTEVARANAAYGGATAAAALLLGPLVDRLGARPILVAGLAILAAAMVASAAAANWASLAAAQGLAGIAAGLVLPATYAYAVVVAPAGREASTIGRVLAGWSISLVAGVPLSAVIAGTLGWRVSFVLLAALSVAASVGFTRVRGPARGATARRDTSLLLAVQSRGVPSLLAVCLAFMTSVYGVYAYLGDHLRRDLGVSAGLAGLVVAAYGVGFGLAGLGDRLVDRLGAGRLFAPALAAVAIVYGLMLPASGTLVAMVVLAMAWGFANHFGLSILVLRLGAADPARRGAVLALNSAVSYAGALVGVAGFGPLYDRAGFAAIAGLAAALMAVAATVAALSRWRDEPAISEPGRSTSPPT